MKTNTRIQLTDSPEVKFTYRKGVKFEDLDNHYSLLCDALKALKQGKAEAINAGVDKDGKQFITLKIYL